MLEADGIGSEFTTTVVDAVPLQPLASVAVTEYVPFIAIVEVAMEGFCETLLNAFGPLHEKPVPPATFN